jgi:hypothetical protein
MARFINFMNLLTEELLKKIMLAKTKHKKVWKFY